MEIFENKMHEMMQKQTKKVYNKLLKNLWDLKTFFFTNV